ncbi:hypothetical protein [Spongiivirga citrea]|uniref:Uncharacterized protein n=1 Tax=Spongiivirga citrea TaxID=1481457 RepID=A0A6M0CR32_9FLAO|nr:hypothetical protein [Spongiivirga citrea]NER18319.1 hypothetical protein [Spongiivirga citrea]
MKNLFFKIVPILLLLFVGCSDRQSEIEGYEYFQFNELDTDQLLVKVPETNDIVVFKNQNEEIISLRVQMSKNGREGAYTRGTFSGGGGYLLYHFDTQRVEMEFVAVPDPFATFVIDISKTRTNSLVGSIYFELWNKPLDESSNLPERINIDFEAITSKMVINVKEYSDVLTFNSPKNEIAGSWFGLDRNVNVIYYDKKYGFIGFDDLDGNTWRGD